MAQVSRKKIIDNFLSNDDNVVRVLREVNFARFVENGDIRRGWEVVLRKVQENRPDKHDIKKCLRYWEKKQLPLQILRDRNNSGTISDNGSMSSSSSNSLKVTIKKEKKSELQMMLTKSNSTQEVCLNNIKTEELPTTSSATIDTSTTLCLNNQQGEWKCIQVASPTTSQTDRERSRDEARLSRDTRIMVGNLTADVEEDEVEHLFSQYGRIEAIFMSSEMGFATIHMRERTNAECAANDLDGFELDGKRLQVRLVVKTNGSSSVDRTSVSVDNLSPVVSNELLEEAFSKFGQVERARVIVDGDGNSTRKGIVEFRKQKAAEKAIRKIKEGTFLLTSTPRVVTASLKAPDDPDGLPEDRLAKTPFYHVERKRPPRFAEVSTFDELCARTWMTRYQVEEEQRESFEQHLKESRANFEREMETCHRQHLASLDAKKLADARREEEKMIREAAEEQQRFSSKVVGIVQVRTHNNCTELVERIPNHSSSIEDGPPRKRSRRQELHYTFQCPKCPDRRFKTQHILNKHMVIHQDRAHHCDQCESRFHLKKDLKVHQRIHSKHKPYSCTYCGKSFTQIGTLNRHTRIHTGEKPFQCDMCQEKFTWNESLQQHLKKCLLKPALLGPSPIRTIQQQRCVVDKISEL